jgi:hypothetical protein
MKARTLPRSPLLQVLELDPFAWTPRCLVFSGPVLSNKGGGPAVGNLSRSIPTRSGEMLRPLNELRTRTQRPI